MSQSSEEPGLLGAPAERISAQPGKLRSIRIRHLLVRFAFGAGTSVAAALVSLAAGPRAGGVFLAFPAILAASLTLIAGEESKADAREDARGAVLGLALAAFAAVGAVLFGRLAWGRGDRRGRPHGGGGGARRLSASSGGRAGGAELPDGPPCSLDGGFDAFGGG